MLLKKLRNKLVLYIRGEGAGNKKLSREQLSTLRQSWLQHDFKSLRFIFPYFLKIVQLIFPVLQSKSHFLFLFYILTYDVLVCSLMFKYSFCHGLVENKHHKLSDEHWVSVSQRNHSKMLHCWRPVIKKRFLQKILFLSFIFF